MSRENVIEEDPNVAWLKSLSDKQLASEIYWLRALAGKSRYRTDLKQARAEQERRAALSALLSTEGR